jgi:Cu/Ag efflux protein CusF
MRTTLLLSMLALVISFVLVGCGPEAKQPGVDSAPGAAQDYPIKGRVVSVAPDKKAVTLDHEDIPNLMRGMEMQFTVEDPQILEGIEAGSEVQGRLTVEDGKYTITRLEKR